MIAVLVPDSDSIDAALDFVARHGGRPVRVVLMRGADGRVRGNALVDDLEDSTNPRLDTTDEP